MPKNTEEEKAPERSLTLFGNPGEESTADNMASDSAASEPHEAVEDKEMEGTQGPKCYLFIDIDALAPFEFRAGQQLKCCINPFVRDFLRGCNKKIEDFKKNVQIIILIKEPTKPGTQDPQQHVHDKKMPLLLSTLVNFMEPEYSFSPEDFFPCAVSKNGQIIFDLTGIRAKFGDLTPQQMILINKKTNTVPHPEGLRIIPCYSEGDIDIIDKFNAYLLILISVSTKSRCIVFLDVDDTLLRRRETLARRRGTKINRGMGRFLQKLKEALPNIDYRILTARPPPPFNISQLRRDLTSDLIDIKRLIKCLDDLKRRLDQLAHGGHQNASDKQFLVRIDKIRVEAELCKLNCKRLITRATNLQQYTPEEERNISTSQNVHIGPHVKANFFSAPNCVWQPDAQMECIIQRLHDLSGKSDILQSRIPVYLGILKRMETYFQDSVSVESTMERYRVEYGIEIKLTHDAYVDFNRTRRRKIEVIEEVLAREYPELDATSEPTRVTVLFIDDNENEIVCAKARKEKLAERGILLQTVCIYDEGSLPLNAYGIFKERLHKIDHPEEEADEGTMLFESLTGPC